MKGWLASLALAGMLALAPAAQAEMPSKDTAAPVPAAAPDANALNALQQSLHPVTGDVPIPEAHATLHLGTAYYFLRADEARRVLIEGWQNPASSVSNVLGIVFPAGKTFMDDSWGAVLTWRGDGHVTDDDANSADYNALLTQMRSGETEENQQRQQGGFPAIHLVGWAQPPSYDAAHHSLIWARQLSFAGQQTDTLNYDVRLLGRTGVLSMNMISSMPQLGEVRAAAEGLGRAATFDAGSRYADFDDSVDTSAGYGLAGLVAAGAGVAVAQKAGLLGLLVLFGKKAIVLVVVAAAAIARFFKRLFGRGDNPPA